MLHFFDVYLQTRLPMTLEHIHELEHRIFLIPELANVFDERHSKTNGMSYSRGIRFSLVTNRMENIEKMKAFFREIHQYTLPEWTQEERDRFDAEEQEWMIRQRQYFGSFAASVFEKKFDAINGIASESVSLESLESMFAGIRFCENFSLEMIAAFAHTEWIFPQFSEQFFWEEPGNMTAILVPVYTKEYGHFVFFCEWIKSVCREHFQYTGNIYDLDHFNVYEGEYILGVIHWYSPHHIA